MATRNSGVAYLDLPWDRIEWSPKDVSRDTIILDGSHFHEVVRMATLTVSALCVLCFLAISMWLWCGYGGRHKLKYLPRDTVWLPLSCMIGYCLVFNRSVLLTDAMRRYCILDSANRVLHELQFTTFPAYIAINIPMGCLSSLADGLLMIYLWRDSPSDIRHAEP